MRYGSRKFILALLTHVSATALLAVGLIEASVWATSIGAALGLYTLGNVGQKALVKPELGASL
jgi:hypothetical protein